MRAAGDAKNAQGLADRGTLSMSEVRAMRVMLDRYMTRPQLRADASTRVEQVRVPMPGGQVRGESVRRPVDQKQR